MAKKRVRKRSKKEDGLYQESYPPTKDDYDHTKKRIFDLIDAAAIISARQNVSRMIIIISYDFIHYIISSLK